jgi:intron-binding protein aquarius
MVELQPAFEKLWDRPTKLQVVTGEMHPAGNGRLVDDEVDSVEIEGVEHLGQYVFEMTKARIEHLKTQGGSTAILPVVQEENVDSDGDVRLESVNDDDDEEEEDEEDDEGQDDED